jgi:hypothetical protein
VGFHCPPRFLEPLPDTSFQTLPPFPEIHTNRPSNPVTPLLCAQFPQKCTESPGG